jgi:hypothetical protein
MDPRRRRIHTWGTSPRRHGNTMKAVVFAGPTISRADAVAELDCTYLAPARQGDVFRAVRDFRPLAIGLIDGVFLDLPAVWHRELLWALAQGVHVFGAASMGALRAAELRPFGMRGVGRIYSAYETGLWPGFDEPFEDDDEVAWWLEAGPCPTPWSICGTPWPPQKRPGSSIARRAIYWSP